ncbi:Aspartate aminotransferase, cytoplasmic [Fusarium oxysporum f. sp. albedinis]|nr:Aspartate aminotransferase, cytoplasmic [Fusarium oxysporum f. sp. albedinis]
MFPYYPSLTQIRDPLTPAGLYVLNRIRPETCSKMFGKASNKIRRQGTCQNAHRIPFQFAFFATVQLRLSRWC